jgi:hypothetical protein
MMKKLLALCLIAALPGCGCWRKNKPKETKSEMTEKKNIVTEKATMPKKAKTHMDMK